MERDRYDVAGWILRYWWAAAAAGLFMIAWLLLSIAGQG